MILLAEHLSLAVCTQTGADLDVFTTLHSITTLSSPALKFNMMESCVFIFCTTSK